MKNFIFKLIKVFQKNKKFFVALLFSRFFFFLPTAFYLRLIYRLLVGRKLDLNVPKSFSEKIQWLKVNYRNPLYSTLVDKYAVKKWVADKIGEKYIIPTLDCWYKASDINFDKLPNQFVLKTTNGGGGDVIICKDKAIFNQSDAKIHLNKALKKNIYKYFKEWPYKDVLPRIIAEKYMEDENGELTDYKFFCFNGVANYCQVIRNRYIKETIDFYDREWNHMPFVGLNPIAKNGLNPPIRPQKLQEMISIAETLSNGLPFVRVDLYSIKNEVYFGEMTFFPASGLGIFEPDEWNVKLGELIKLPLEDNKKCQ